MAVALSLPSYTHGHLLDTEDGVSAMLDTNAQSVKYLHALRHIDLLHGLAFHARELEGSPRNHVYHSRVAVLQADRQLNSGSVQLRGMTDRHEVTGKRVLSAVNFVLLIFHERRTKLENMPTADGSRQPRLRSQTAITLNLGVQKHAADLELAAHVVDDSLRVRPSSVQLVDERYPRHRVPFHLPVDGKGLRLHP